MFATLDMVVVAIKLSIFTFINLLVKCYNFILLKYWLQLSPIQSTYAVVYNIRARFKPSVMMPASADNFIAVIKCYVNPEIVLSENITLFNVTKKEAIFIDAGNLDVFDSSHGAFVYNAQFSSATKVIRLPLQLFHEISLKIRVGDIPIVHLPNHGRCGSTLLTRMMEAIPDALSISETMAFADIAMMVQKGEVDHDTGREMIRSALLCTLKHATTRKSKLVFIKLQHFATFITDMMIDVYPCMKHVYMYRQPVPFIRSWEKLIIANGWGWLITDDLCFKLAGAGCYPILKDAPELDIPRVRSMGLFEKIGLIWMTTACAYQELLRKGYQLKSLKYEDMLENPQQTLLKLFQYLGMDGTSLPDTDAVIAEDSQKGSDFTSDT